MKVSHAKVTQLSTPLCFTRVPTVIPSESSDSRFIAATAARDGIERLASINKRIFNRRIRILCKQWYVRVYTRIQANFRSLNNFDRWVNISENNTSRFVFFYGEIFYKCQSKQSNLCVIRDF